MKRCLILASALTVVSLAAVPAFGQATTTGAKPTAAAAKPAAAGPFVQKRTPDGQPDISGYWSTGTYTPLQRPTTVTKEFYTEQELAEIEQRAKVRENEQTTPGTQNDVHPDDSQFGLDRNQVRFGRTQRTSLIVDPPDGRIPPQIPEAVARNAAIAATRKQMIELERVQNMAYDDRCIVMAGIQPPMYIGGYLPNYQIIQSPGYVTILTERLHNARIIPIDGRPFPPSSLRSWQGISRGRWEGNTLVVETRNADGRIQAARNGVLAGQPFSGATKDVLVTERFTRMSDDALELKFTVQDDLTWARPWTAVVPITKMETQGPFFEMACHEGNHAVANTLRGERLSEQRAAEAAKKRGSTN